MLTELQPTTYVTQRLFDSLSAGAVHLHYYSRARNRRKRQEIEAERAHGLFSLSTSHIFLEVFSVCFGLVSH